MKIEKVRVENFRAIRDQVVNFDDYTCFVGPNGAGKSTILNALNVFFREAKAGATNLVLLSREDFHGKNTAEPIRITVTFKDLSASAKESLSDYVRHDRLIVTASAVWDEASQSAPVSQHGSRLAMRAFAPFFAKVNANESVAQLKECYRTLKEQFDELPAPGIKQVMIDSLRAFEGTHPQLCEEIPSGDEFYGVSKGAHKLGPHVQWIFIPAVKDATSEQLEAKDTALGKLVERTVRSQVQFSQQIKEIQRQAAVAYDALLATNQGALSALSTSLQTRLADWFTPSAKLEVRWDKDPQKAIRVEEPFAKIWAGDDDFLGELGRLGHGMQRSYMFALLSELAASGNTDGPTMILAVEEPELFQHPPQAKHLADVLVQLSTANAQVMTCTHSPYFINGRGFEDVRMVRRSPQVSVHQLKLGDLSTHLTSKVGPRYRSPSGVQARINQCLQPVLREMFFVPKLVLVEGLEDIAYITTALHLENKWNEWRRGGAHIVCVDGKSGFIEPLAIAQLLGIPRYLIWDADTDLRDRDGRHKTDNENILNLLGVDAANAFPDSIVNEAAYWNWPINLTHHVRADFRACDLERWKNEMNAELGHTGGMDKNAMFISGLLTKAWAEGKPSAILQSVCNRLLAFSSGS